jgi:hypothetical protein
MTGGVKHPDWVDHPEVLPACRSWRFSSRAEGPLLFLLIVPLAVRLLTSAFQLSLCRRGAS